MLPTAVDEDPACSVAIGKLGHRALVREVSTTAGHNPPDSCAVTGSPGNPKPPKAWNCALKGLHVTEKPKV